MTEITGENWFICRRRPSDPTRRICYTSALYELGGLMKPL